MKNSILRIISIGFFVSITLSALSLSASELEKLKVENSWLRRENSKLVNINSKLMSQLKACYDAKKIADQKRMSDIGAIRSKNEAEINKLFGVTDYLKN